ncbi:MAG: HypC/HybG/HupF family hydrogenase formation chaperone [Candidatus Thermoplasmatota archaeon]|nr:HypC/HybG/HupF family hydrogenase formation chaperone [Candidatus Thermoplasmatota archaeon]
MCLAIPGKILKITDNKAEVDFGEGSSRQCNISLVDAKVGDYVVVHAGYAIQIMDEKEALETRKLWDQIFEANKNKK